MRIFRLLPIVTPKTEPFVSGVAPCTGKLVLVDIIVQPVTGKVRIVAEVNQHDGSLRDGVKAVLTIVSAPKQ